MTRAEYVRQLRRRFEAMSAERAAPMPRVIYVPENPELQEPR